MKFFTRLCLRLLLLGAFFSGTALQAQPGWTTQTLNPANFQYSMTVTAVLQIDGVESTDNTDFLGAFVGNDLRGRVQPTLVVSANRYIAYLVIYSNAVSGETVSFKMYDASGTVEVDAINVVAFQDNSNSGTTANPVVITNNNAPTALALSPSVLAENSPGGSTVGTFTTTDADAGDTHVYTLVTGDGDADNASFQIAGNQLQTAAGFVPNFENKSSYSVRVQTDDQSGGRLSRTFTISINNANDAPTDIGLSNAIFDENNAIGSVIGQFSTTDEDASDSFGYSLVAGAGDTDNSRFSINGNQLITNQAFDFETQNSFTIRVQTQDAGGATFAEAFTLSVRNVNEAPTALATTPATLTLAENSPNGTVVGTVVATDPDAGDTFAYSLAPAAGGDDNDRFVLVGNEIRSIVVPNYEVQRFYYVNVRATDSGGLTFTELLTITITDGNDAPTALVLSSEEVAENAPINTVVGSFTTTDPDAADTHTYTLMTSGQGSEDFARFNINGSELRTSEVFDFEVKNSYKIRVRANDSGTGNLAFEQAFVIAVANANDLPTALSLSNNLVAENEPIGTTIGNFSTTDQDVGETFSYSLVAGAGDADNGSFTIVGNELKNIVNFDFETKLAYAVRVRATDSRGGTIEQAFTITILDANDAPSAINLNNSSVAENTAAGTLIGTFSTADTDTGSSFTYSFSGTGNDNASFAISGDQLLSNAVFDFEQKAFYVIQVTSSDGNGGSVSQQLTIAITDANDAPTDIQLSNNSLAENQAVGTNIGQLFTTDADAGNTHSYTLVNGLGDDDNASFTLSAAGLLQSNAVFDFESKSSFTIRVRTTDSGTGNLTFEKAFTISVTNANDAPTDIALDLSQFAENQSLGTAIGQFSTTDVDANEAFTYALVAGAGDADNGSFVLVGNQLRTNAFFNFEAKNAYTIRVQTTDRSGATFSEAFTLTVLDANDAPTDITLSNNLVNENAPASTAIGTFTVADVDASDSHSFTLESGLDAGSFVLNGNQLLTLAPFDYEAKPFYYLNVTVTDLQGATFTKLFTIQVVDQNDAPTAISLIGTTVAENSAAGTVVGQLFASDVDNSTHTFTLVSGMGSDDNASFSISGNQLQVNAALDFETRATYTVRVRATDAGTLFTEQAFTLTLTDANDAPTALALSNQSIDENQPLQSLVGLFQVSDQDATDSYTFSLVTGAGSTDNARFRVVANQLQSNSVFDFESQNSFSIRARVTDKGGQILEQAFTISINDTNDAPTALTLSNASVAENAVLSTTIGTFSTIDTDAADAGLHTYTLNTGLDAASFLLFQNELKLNTALDFESKQQYFLSVTTTDPAGLSLTRQFAITVTNVNDLPTALDLSNAEIPENQPIGTAIGTFATTDPDATDTHTYTLVAGIGAEDNASFSISGNTLQSAASFNFETKNSYSIRVQTADGNGGTLQKTFTVAVTNRGDTPTQFGLTNNRTEENQLAGTLIGNFFDVRDEDAGDTFFFSLVSGTGSTDNGSFQIIENQLFSLEKFDFETKSSYSIRVQVRDSYFLTHEEVFTISIQDGNDAPDAIALSNNTINENADQNAVIGTLTTTDADAGQTFFYSIDPATPNADRFAIFGNELRANTVFNFEEKAFYVLTIVSSDGNGGSVSEQFAIIVNNQNDVPTDLLTTALEVNENAPSGTVVADLSTVDQDSNDSHTYSLVSGIGSADNALFQISGNQLQTAAELDFENRSTYNIRMQTDDGNGGTFQKTFTVTVKDQNDAPTGLSLSFNQVAENQPVQTLVGEFATTDQDAGETFTYALVAGSGDTDNGRFVVIGHQLFTNEVFDYEEQTSRSVRVRSTDSRGASIFAQFNVVIVPGNDAPTNLTLAGNSVAENAAVGTLIGTLTTTDEDAGDAHTYSIAPGLNGDQFVVSGNQLLTNAVFDFESQNLYYLNITTTDGSGGTFTKQFSVNVTNANDAPTALAVSNLSVAENQASGTLIGYLSTTDQDSADSFTYSLVAGDGDAGNASFQVVVNQLQANASFDFESQNSYAIRLQTDDGNGGTLQQTFTVSITDGNDAPTAISLNNNQVAENSAVSTEVGSFSTTDADAGDSFTYGFTDTQNYPDNTAFYLEGNVLKTAAIFDFESKPVYAISIQVKDAAGATFVQTFNIQVTAANDAPTDIQLSNSSVAENSAIGTLVGSFSTTDPDAGDTFSYAISGGNDAAAFAIQGANLLTAAVFNFEVKSAYFLKISSTDAGGKTTEKEFSVSILNANDAPTALEITKTTLSENLPAGTSVGNLFTTDPDAGDTFTYSLVSGTGDEHNAAFSISGNSLQAAESFDFETQSAYSVRVQTTDAAGATLQQAFSISILDANDAPTDVDLLPKLIQETAGIGSVVGNFLTTDADANDTHQYLLEDLTGSTDNNNFLISGNQLVVNTALSFASKPFHTIRVKTIDRAGASFAKEITVQVVNENNPPTDLALSNNTIVENALVGTAIGTLSVTDADAGDAHIFTLSGPDAAAFYIDGAVLRNNEVFDFETKPVYSLSITVTDAGGLTYSEPFVIEVIDTNDPPIQFSLTSQSIAENLPAGSLVGAFSTTDPDDQSGFSYSFQIVEGNEENDGFFIDGNLLKSATPFNYEAKDFYTIRVRVTDSSGGSLERVFGINILDANDAPTAISLSPDFVDEDAEIGTIVGDLTTTDEDQFDTFFYTLPAGVNDNGSFVIRNGHQIATDERLLDVETKPSYTISVQVEDQGGVRLVQELSIQVRNINEKPEILDGQEFSIAENSEEGTVVGTVEAFDIDGHNLTFALLLDDTQDPQKFAFRLESQSGNLVVNNPSELNFERQELYRLFISVTDAGLGNLRDTAEVLVRVSDVVEEDLPLPVTNYLSPNGDEMNDVFAIQSIELYQGFKLTVFDASGEIVYEKENYQNDWRGTYNGERLPSGAYLYLFRNAQTGKQFKGIVNIVR